MYLPASSSSARTQFISTHLRQHIAHLPPSGKHILAGDFNFVADTALDSIAASSRAERDRPTAHAFSAAFPQLIDSYRARNPTRRALSHFHPASVTSPVHPAGGARLDRIYVASELMPHVASSTIHTASPSDHRVASLLLIPRTPATRGPGIHRARTAFTEHSDLKQAMTAWLLQQAANMPAEDQPAAVLQWWPAFKRQLAATAAQRTREAQRRRRSHGATVAAASAAVRDAQTAVDADPQAPAAVAALATAQASLSSALRTEGADAAHSVRVEWLRQGERPNPAITRAVHPPQDTRLVPALRDSAGRLATDLKQLPGIVASYWSGISTAPADISATAQQAVLGVLDTEGPKLPLQEAAAIDSLDVSPSEVERALQQQKPGKAPGWDGIPGDLYRHFRGTVAPMLARLYTAIGSTQQLPAGFHRGVISTIYKERGDLTSPGNYRPITLLCSDYRVLAKVLANRLNPALGSTISLEQSAFLHKRLIGANIHFLRILPHLLRNQQRSAVVAFLDFSKAYDTIHRPFLLAAMQTMGVGQGFLAWTRLLLSDTHSVANVNGYLSDPVPIRAGVRQGCPLAPLLYLFVAQALLCWLKHHRVGVHLLPTDPSPCTAVQFADDTEVPLNGPEELPAFLGYMRTFAQASGQRLNLDKTELLPIGANPPNAPLPQLDAGGQAAQPTLSAPPPSAASAANTIILPHPPTAAHPQQPSHPNDGVSTSAQPATSQPQLRWAGLKVVQSVKSLGVPFTNPPATPTPDWADNDRNTRHRLQKVSRCHLSAFGRATAAGAYCLHLSTYLMEHCAMPPSPILSEWTRLTARLVDRGLGPDDAERRATGVPAQLLPGHPTTGGFGVLPLEEHITARCVKWAAAFARSETAWADGGSARLAPWQQALRHLLLLRHPACRPMAVLTAQPGSQFHAAMALPAELQRLVFAFGSLPPMVDVAEAPLIPGAWCCSTPLWGNPFLPNAGAPERRPGLEHYHLNLSYCRRLTTIGDLVQVYDAVRQAFSAPRTASTSVADILRDARTLWSQLVRQYLDPPMWVSGAFADRHEITAQLETLHRDIHPDWLQAARTAITQRQQLPSVDAVVAMLLPRLGWPVPLSAPITLDTITVRAATLMQLGPLQQRRQQCHSQYVRAALEPHADQTAQQDALKHLAVTFRRVWQQVRWENENKEILWRLAVDGVPLLGNSHMHGSQPWVCPCREFARHHSSPPRTHHFWECEVAIAVREHIEHYAQDIRLTRQHLWLVMPPRGIHRKVWEVVCLSALSAMEHGRRHLHAQSHPDGRCVAAACTRAVVDFWSRLRDFAALGMPKGWKSVPADHPFLGIQHDKLRYNGPLLEHHA